MISLLVLYLFLPFMLLDAVPSKLPISAPLNISQFSNYTDKPFGNRLFLTSHPNHLNLVWCCDLPANINSTEAAKPFNYRTNAMLHYNMLGGPHNNTVTGYGETRSASNQTEVAGRYDWVNKMVQYNTTLQLKPNYTLIYTISCNGNQSSAFEVMYKYWDNTRDNDTWTIASSGSLGLYNTTEVALDTVRAVAETKHMENMLWVIPGGIVNTILDKDILANITEEDANARWRAWLHLTQNVTCCSPIVAAPSELDLLPSKSHNHYMWYLELPFHNHKEDEPWFSFNHRNLHVVSVCTFCDLSDNSTQYTWLEKDLAAANKTTHTHWTLVIGHEILHSWSLEDDIKWMRENVYPPTKAREQLDKLFEKYKVDFAVWGHERWYERTKPLTKSMVSDERASNELSNVNGTIHYTCGTGGAPLQPFNMAKNRHAAYYRSNRFGACLFTRIADNEYTTAFVHNKMGEHGYEVRIEDYLQVTKDIPEHKKVLPESHFAKFMKVFGIVLLIGVVIMALITILVKAVQKHDPSFITNKIRNIKFRQGATRLDGSREQVVVEEVELDAEDLSCRKEDKVMLLDEPDQDDLQLHAAKHMYGVMM